MNELCPTLVTVCKDCTGWLAGVLSVTAPRSLPAQFSRSRAGTNEQRLLWAGPCPFRPSVQSDCGAPVAVCSEVRGLLVWHSRDSMKTLNTSGIVSKQLLKHTSQTAAILCWQSTEADGSKSRGWLGCVRSIQFGSLLGRVSITFWSLPCF